MLYHIPLIVHFVDADRKLRSLSPSAGPSSCNINSVSPSVGPQGCLERYGIDHEYMGFSEFVGV